MSKFISKQLVSIWYALTALLATFLVGQVVLWFFSRWKEFGRLFAFYPDEFDSHDNGSLLFHRLR